MSASVPAARMNRTDMTEPPQMIDWVPGNTQHPHRGRWVRAIIPEPHICKFLGGYHHLRSIRDCEPHCGSRYREGLKAHRDSRGHSGTQLGMG